MCPAHEPGSLQDPNLSGPGQEEDAAEKRNPPCHPGWQQRPAPAQDTGLALHLGTQAAHCPSLRHTCGSVLPLNDSGSNDNDKPRPVFQRKGDLPEYRGGPHGVVLRPAAVAAENVLETQILG